MSRRIHHPYNALDTMKEKVREQLGPEGISFDWEQSEYCDKTFILMLRLRDVEIEFNLLFHPESYSITAANNCPDSLLNTMLEKLDACIHY
uniref:Uncharacterized protein n=1 Tax=viral metagenome TaxID=1070528 RepID=A0A6C0CHV5_9ZZZZ